MRVQFFIALSIVVVVLGLTANADPSIPSDEVRELDVFLRQDGVETTGCSLSRAGKRPMMVFFVFEGRNGYSEELGSNFRRFQSLDPVCDDSQSKITFSNGRWIDFGTAVGQVHGMVRNSSGGSPVGLKNLVFEGICRQAKLRFADIEVFYYPSDLKDLKPVVDCARQLASTFSPKIMLMGYSNGGSRAIELAGKLDEAHVRVSYGATVDPVPLGVQGGLSLAAKYLGPTSAAYIFESFTGFTVPQGIYWDNFWQETDNRWSSASDLKLGRMRGLQGSRVGNAHNKLIVPPLNADNVRPNGGHWRIFLNHEVIPKIAASLSAFFKN